MLRNIFKSLGQANGGAPAGGGPAPAGGAGGGEGPAGPVGPAGLPGLPGLLAGFPLGAISVGLYSPCPAGYVLARDPWPMGVKVCVPAASYVTSTVLYPAIPTFPVWA